jgi:hypothetical protein
MSDPEWDRASAWLDTRLANLKEMWGEELYEIIRSNSWTMEVELRLDDAADSQARAERFGYMYGKPIPDADAALAELIAWLKTGEMSEPIWPSSPEFESGNIIGLRHYRDE